MRILVVRLSSLGDVVCALPVAVAMRRSFPECHITWVVDPRFSQVVERCSAVDDVICARPRFSVDSLPKFGEAFDVAMDLQGLLKSAVVVGRAKAKSKIGYHWQREGARFFSAPILPDPTSIHVVDQYVDVARFAGAEVEFAEFGLKPKSEDVESISARFDVRAPYVVLNPGAGWASKRWPTERFADLSRRLDHEGYRAILIGGKAEVEREVVSKVIKAGGVVTDLGGQTSIAELIALIAGARGHVGGDTGSTHIAAALGVPAIGLYSITRPSRSCPYGQIERCHHDPRGLEFIEVEPVLHTLLEAMK